MHSRRIAVRAVVLGLLLAGWVVAAVPPAKAERVTVKKGDGTTVAGELVAADHDGVIVQPPGKPGVQVVWKDVASVSNGLTRTQAVTQWKAKRKDRLCDTCHGDRAVKHEACGGTGVEPAAKQSCATCKGTGSAGKCTNPKCKAGKVDCPGPCLKRSVGKWVMHDGIMSRESKTGPRNMYYVHDSHIGEVVEVSANGMQVKGNCPTCDKAATVDCGTCAGKAQMPCKSCRGVGVTGPACKDCKEGQVKCADCQGAGIRP